MALHLRILCIYATHQGSELRMHAGERPLVRAIVGPIQVSLGSHCGGPVRRHVQINYVN